MCKVVLDHVLTDASIGTHDASKHRSKWRRTCRTVNMDLVDILCTFQEWTKRNHCHLQHRYDGLDTVKPVGSG